MPSELGLQGGGLLGAAAMVRNCPGSPCPELAYGPGWGKDRHFLTTEQREAEGQFRLCSEPASASS